MIKTDELMLGNLVDYKGEYAIITEILEDRVALNTWGSYIKDTDINPIELTNEIISKTAKDGSGTIRCRTVHEWQNWRKACLDTPLDITPLLKPKPILTTEDGVDVYDGQKYWSVKREGFFNGYWKDKPTFHVCDTTSGKNPNCIYFSTEKLAQAYLNKVWAETEYNNLLKAKSEQ